MSYMIQITEDSAMDLKEHAKKILKHGKELFECIEDLCEDGGSMGERGGGRYGNRGGDGGYGGGNSGGSYGNRMSYREEDEYDDDPYMAERRGVRGTGRYSRYRR